MNAANLQLQGLYLAIAAINNALASKGLLSRDEIEDALRHAEQTAENDERLIEDMTPSGRDAIAFSVRLLRLANKEGAESATFSELAKRVGQTKDPLP
jgi:hypothetical protein